MSQKYQISDAAVSESPLTAQLHPLDRKVLRGAETPLAFAGKPAELASLLRAAGVFDLGYRTFLRATGKDRVRWLNGMITQAVKSMAPGQTAYTLVLNPQGRIQGDANVSFHEDSLLLQTDRSQSGRLLTHLRRYIIMDDVKLEPLDASLTALGIAGPHAPDALRKALSPSHPDPSTPTLPEDGRFQTAAIAGAPVTLVRAYSPLVPRFEIWVAPENVLAVWNALLAAGALPCGAAALEDLRILEAVPQFDQDISDKHLPQETNLTRALNFTKGCYIGQEIVERIRSRATVHRSLRLFSLQGSAPVLAPGEKIELRAGDAPVGELTSVAAFALPEFSGTLALGTVRTEALPRPEPGPEPRPEPSTKPSTEPHAPQQENPIPAPTLRYDGGAATPLEGPPRLPPL